MEPSSDIMATISTCDDALMANWEATLTEFAEESLTAEAALGVQILCSEQPEIESLVTDAEPPPPPSDSLATPVLPPVAPRAKPVDDDDDDDDDVDDDDDDDDDAGDGGLATAHNEGLQEDARPSDVRLRL